MPTDNFENLTTTHAPDALPPQYGHPEVGETLAHNAAVLANDIGPVIEDDSLVGKNYEGQRVFASLVVLYVDRSTGSIEGIGSHEKIHRAKSRAVTDVEPSALEAWATGLPRAMLDDPNTVRVYAWFERALLAKATEESEEYKIQRPSSWVRNDRVRLSQKNLSFNPLEKKIPDAIERGIFLKSIEEHNKVEESDIYDPEKG